MYILYFITAIRCIHNCIQTASSTQDGNCGRKRVSTCTSDDMGGSKKCRYEDSTLILNDAEVDEALSNWESNGMGYEQLLGSADVSCRTGPFVADYLPEISEDDLRSVLGFTSDNYGEQAKADEILSLDYELCGHRAIESKEASVILGDGRKDKEAVHKNTNVGIPCHDLHISTEAKPYGCLGFITAKGCNNAIIGIEQCVPKNAIIETATTISAHANYDNGTDKKRDEVQKRPAYGKGNNMENRLAKLIDLLIYHDDGFLKCVMLHHGVADVIHANRLILARNTLRYICLLVIDNLGPVNLIPEDFEEMVSIRFSVEQNGEQIDKYTSKLISNYGLQRHVAETLNELKEEVHTIDHLYKSRYCGNRLSFDAANIESLKSEIMNSCTDSDNFDAVLRMSIHKRVHNVRLRHKFTSMATKTYSYSQIRNCSDYLEKTYLYFYMLNHQIAITKYIKKANNTLLNAWLVYRNMRPFAQPVERFRMFLDWITTDKCKIDRIHFDKTVKLYEVLRSTPNDDNAWVIFLCHLDGFCRSLVPSTSSHSSLVYFDLLANREYIEGIKISALQNRNMIWKIFGINKTVK